jgi:WhiB family redox-sensing transcriptional regulator
MFEGGIGMGEPRGESSSVNLEGRSVVAVGVLEALMSGAYWSDYAGLAQRPEWQQHAACRGVGASAFFRSGRTAARVALAFCQVCPVADDCRAAALDAGEVGVWGGTTTQQRKEGRAA